MGNYSGSLLKSKMEFAPTMKAAFPIYQNAFPFIEKFGKNLSLFVETQRGLPKSLNTLPQLNDAFFQPKGDPIEPS